MSIYIARSTYRSSARGFSPGKAWGQMLNLFSGKPSKSAAAPKYMHAAAFERIRKRATFKNNGRKMGAEAAQSISAVKNAMGQVRAQVLRFEFGPSAVIGGLFLIAVLLSLLYLMHFNQVATKGYDLRRLEADRQQLLNQYDIKNMKLAEVQSLANITEKDRVSVMRRPAEILYVRGNTALAKK